MTYKLGILSTHPIQYYSPLYRELASRPEIDLRVYYAFQATQANQADAGFGVAFEWDIPLLDGYQYEFLQNRSSNPNSSSYRGCDTPDIAEIIKREKFDAFLVHGWYTKSYRQAMKACWRTNTRLMVRGDSTLLMQQHWLKRMAKWVSHRQFIPRFDRYLIVGQRAREYYLHYGADPKKMFSSPHFVENERFAKAAALARVNRDELRAKWNLPKDATVMLFAGKFIPKKRPLDFVKSIASTSNNIFGLMVGDGSVRPDIESEIRSRSARIRMAGFLNQSEIAKAYAVSDAVVLMSDGTETWGLVVNEAMACGLPAIVSDRVGCAPDLVIPGTTGAIYAVGDVRELARNMERFTNRQFLSSTSEAAKKRIGTFTAAIAADGFCQAMQRE